MKNSSLSFRILLLFATLIVISPVSGAINTITPGSMVFIGEQGLDITAVMDGDTQIGWWASAASIADSSPSFTIPVSSPSSFSVSPNLFGPGKTGVWYRLTPSGRANGTAFNVVDPQIALKAEDTTVSVDVTDKWVPTGDSVRFQIDTNLVSIAGRPGMSSVPVTIVVQDPNGGRYTSLLNSAGTATSIVDIPVTTTPFLTGSIWDTGHRDTYSPGTYTIWAECNANSMKDNYNQEGKTVSPKVTVLNQDHNPLIKTYETTATVPVTTSVATATRTSIPATTTPVTTLTTTVPPATTPLPVTSAATLPPATATQPTKSPGFEGHIALLGISLAVLAVVRRN